MLHIAYSYILYIIVVYIAIYIAYTSSLCIYKREQQDT